MISGSVIKGRNVWFIIDAASKNADKMFCLYLLVLFPTIFLNVFELTFYFLVLPSSCLWVARMHAGLDRIVMRGSDSQRMARAPILIISCVLHLYNVYTCPKHMNDVHIIVLKGEQTFFLALPNGQMVKLLDGQMGKVWQDWPET